MANEERESEVPTDQRARLVERLMAHREITREEAEALVDAHMQDRSADIDPELLEGLDRS